MKTAISIPDELFERAEALARQLGKSRSAVYQDALREYLLRRDADSVTRDMDRLIDDVGPAGDDWVDEAGRRTLERSEW